MKNFACLVWLMMLAVVSAPPSNAQETAPSKGRLVRTYIDAFNQRQIDAMLRMVTDDVEWLSVTGKKIAVESTGKEELKKGMQGYFKSVPTAKSELIWMESTPSRVAVLEKAKWSSRSGEQSQSSLAVYEFRENLISRVYYYPAEKPNQERSEP